MTKVTRREVFDGGRVTLVFYRHSAGSAAAEMVRGRNVIIVAVANDRRLEKPEPKKRRRKRAAAEPAKRRQA